jgi:MFS family permease
VSLFGGVAADRLDKRKILIFTQSAFMALAFLLAALTQAKLIAPIQIMCIAVLNGIVMAFDAPSRQAVVIELVGRDHLFNAVALNSVAFNSSRVIGPALAGILVAAVGMSGCFFLNAVSFIPLIFTLFFIRLKKNTREYADNSAWRDLKDGLIFIRDNRLFFVLVAMVGVVSLFGISYVILMPVFASAVLHVGVKGLGVLMSAVGLGALAAALILARLGDFQYKGRLLVSSAFVFGLSLILFSLCRSYLFAAFILMFLGGASVSATALINTILQTRAPDRFRGRVMSVFMLTFAGMMPFGNLIAGSLAQVMGVARAVMASGLACTLFFSFITLRFPGLRKL